ncbi:YitT family protein [Megamonas hypermegale]|uniref:YitT family protein n=1 Tax=Megamonas hypermegale TaxID=158847 RepID=UPI00195DBA5F|nr:YitT family protein [Megamonas hypermegale]MBM6761490.1 YitT family protein [Megamonas hypermegale]
MKKYFLQYSMIVIGALISAISCNLFLIPNHFLSGGITGIAIIFHYLFDLPIGIQNIVFNIPILYIAYHFFGKTYFINTILGTFLYSTFIDLTSFLTPLTPLHNNPMLSAIVAGVVSGIGFGLILRANANTGGADVVAALIRKLYSYNIGTMIFALNCLIVLCGLVLFSFEAAIYTLIYMYIMGEVDNRIVTGFNKRKSIMIVSDKSEEIAEHIMNELGRGVTFIEGEGGYTHTKKRILYVVITLTQLSKVKEIALKSDAKSFFIISNASEVNGKGFSYK